MRVVAVVQARVGSTRLPGKTLLPLNGKPLLQRVVDRVRAASGIDEVVVATATGAENDAIREICRDMSVAVHSGHPTDLLDRHYRVALEWKADAVVKIPSDCPLIDPSVIDRVIGRFRELSTATGIDFVSNLHPATYPDGNDVEIMTTAVLDTAWREAGRGFEREHTTPYIWDRPDRFRTKNVAWETGLDFSMSHRFTVDYLEDYELVRTVYERLHREGEQPFTLNDILGLLEAEPSFRRINAHLAGVNWYRHHLGELHTVGVHETVRIAGA
jgi:spore coat polysaccharide biosynthesis protein SpsF